MSVKIATALKPDGRWRAEAPALRGVLTYGRSEDEARAKARAIARCVIAERDEQARDGLVSYVTTAWR
jgi:predicted RNase H-like HicB family nuclease